jgi:23S rRNA pseudouridine1911/1915/1917 synthase
MKENYFYEGEDFLGVSKPAGLSTTYKNSDDKGDCLIDRVRQKYGDIDQVDGFKPREGGLLYRLDNATSGVVVIARNQDAFDRFLQMQQDFSIGKWYYALCSIGDRDESLIAKEDLELPGTTWEFQNFVDLPMQFFRATGLAKLREDFLNSDLWKSAQYQVVDCPIGHSAKSSKRMIAVKSSRYKTSSDPIAVKTFFRILGSRNDIYLVEAFITKGMRHQIRVHLSEAGLPIIGDGLYGVDSGDFNLGRRMYLHCGRVGGLVREIRT